MIKKTPTAPYKRASRAVLNAYINKPSDYPPIVREQSITPIENRFFIGDGRGPECRAESAHIVLIHFLFVCLSGVSFYGLEAIQTKLFVDNICQNV